MSNFGTATLDLDEKAGFRPFFQQLGSKLTKFWNKLICLSLNCYIGVVRKT